MTFFTFHFDLPRYPCGQRRHRIILNNCSSLRCMCEDTWADLQWLICVCPWIDVVCLVDVYILVESDNNKVRCDEVMQYNTRAISP